MRDAEHGKLSVIIKHGRPVFFAMPFDVTLVKSGVVLSLAIKLYHEKAISLARAAKLANCSTADFMEILAKHNIPVVQYSADELSDELDILK